MRSIRRCRNGRWRAGRYAPDGKQHSKNFASKSDASRHVRTMESAKDRGGYLDPRLGKTLLRVVAADWFKTTARLKPKTRATYESILKTHVIPAFGSTPTARMTRG